MTPSPDENPRKPTMTEILDQPAALLSQYDSALHALASARPGPVLESPASPSFASKWALEAAKDVPLSQEEAYVHMLDVTWLIVEEMVYLRTLRDALQEDACDEVSRVSYAARAIDPNWVHANVIAPSGKRTPLPTSASAPQEIQTQQVTTDLIDGFILQFETLLARAYDDWLVSEVVPDTVKPGTILWHKIRASRDALRSEISSGIAIEAERLQHSPEAEAVGDLSDVFE